jgi:membrane-bound lytic murein transglycosylase A
MKKIILSFAVSLFLSSCAGVAPENAPLALTPANFGDLPGWNKDDFSGAKEALARSCGRILKQDAAKAFGPTPVGGTYGDWQSACQALPAATDMRVYLQQWFTPYAASGGGAREGLFTGYYESALRGSRTRHGPYQTPLYKRPTDLVMVDLGEFREELKGQRIAGRVIDAKLKPYEDRAAIVAGNWPHNDQAFIWVDDPVEAFFVQIQGSGRVLMDDGSQVSIGYDGQNGHVYYAVGRELVKRGIMPKEEVSMQSIRAWLEAHPQEAAEIMNTNKSYVFFKETGAAAGPQGGEGVALTPLRSLAIDRSKIPYGIPMWLDIPEPAPDAPALRRLMVAQDTGGAIRGPVRGDVFWGHGRQAEDMAGVMKAQGRYWLLLPKR